MSGEQLQRAAIPWHWYVDDGVLARERAAIFARTWQYVGHAGELAEPGDMVPVDCAGLPAIILRNENGELRAFENMCRHRGSILVDERCNRASVQCPYHAWTYALDGQLRAAPRVDRQTLGTGFDLRPLRLAQWGPFIFLNAGDDAPPFDSVLGKIPELVERAGVDVDSLRHVRRAQSQVSGNWKICCENFLECYHCAVAHPGFSARIDVRPGRYELEYSAADWYSSQYGPTRDAEARPGEISRAQFHFVWPNLTINIVPGHPNLSIGPAVPASSGATRRVLDYFAAPGVDDQWLADMFAWDDQVGAEDTALVERMQRGAEAAALSPGAGHLPHLLERSEQLIAHFQRRVVNAVEEHSAL